MKKCVLLALTVLGFTSLSNAAPKDLSLTYSDEVLTVVCEAHEPR